MYEDQGLYPQSHLRTSPQALFTPHSKNSSLFLGSLTTVLILHVSLTSSFSICSLYPQLSSFIVLLTCVYLTGNPVILCGKSGHRQWLMWECSCALVSILLPDVTGGGHNWFALPVEKTHRLGYAPVPVVVKVYDHSVMSSIFNILFEVKKIPVYTIFHLLIAEKLLHMQSRNILKTRLHMI